MRNADVFRELKNEESTLKRKLEVMEEITLSNFPGPQPPNSRIRIRGNHFPRQRALERATDMREWTLRCPYLCCECLHVAYKLPAYGTENQLICFFICTNI